jgi:hypothetical protein
MIIHYTRKVFDLCNVTIVNTAERLAGYCLFSKVQEYAKIRPSRLPIFSSGIAYTLEPRTERATFLFLAGLAIMIILLALMVSLLKYGATKGPTIAVPQIALDL